MSINKNITIAFILLLAAFYSFGQSIPKEFIKEYYLSFSANSGLDTSSFCLNSVVIVRYKVTTEKKIVDINCTPLISKYLQTKIKIAIKRTEGIWKNANIRLDTSLTVVQFIYIDDDSGCPKEAAEYLNISNSDSLGTILNNKSANKYVQMKNIRDRNISQSSFDMLSTAELPEGAFMMPAIRIRRTY